MDYEEWDRKMKLLARGCAESARRAQRNFRALATIGFTAAFLFYICGLIISFFWSWLGGGPIISGIIIAFLSRTIWREGDAASERFLKLRESILNDIERLRFH